MRLLNHIGRLWMGAGGGVLEDAAVAIEGERIAWAGPAQPGPPPEMRTGVEEVYGCGGALVTPGLIDAHTHPVYAGDRMAEIARRSAGASYSEIAAMGGGIGATVAATRKASAAELRALVAERLAAWLRSGTTTVEAKTGYHLEREGELEALRILVELGREPALPRVEPTFLGAHAVPAGASAEQFIDEVVGWCPPAAAAGARFCDVFCDEGYFSVPQSRKVLAAGRRAGLIPRIHADELAHSGGSLLAAESGAQSADHLLYADDSDTRALAEAGVVATLSPGTALAMGRMPPASGFLDAGVTLALGTDHNPGTCGATSMSLVIALAVAAFGLSVDEALTAATAGGAVSLRLNDRGTIEAGKLADLVVWDAEHEGAFAWSYGLAPLEVFLGGKPTR
ncbi:MAG: imidazolonepropionase [Actinobacteria bacterium]|nr:imidazolonepropionase [Actinomycetota bacterium]